jgi:hypothetical protein
MKHRPITAYAQLNARIMPQTRGKRFELPLKKALAKSGLGEVMGGGTLQQKTGEIEYCGIDIDLFDVAQGIPFICAFLAKQGAPKGSKLLYKQDKRQVEEPFGTAEGLAVYLNGTDLPAAVYEQSSIDEVIESFARLLGKQGAIQGYWQGPTETALYLYGESAEEMLRLIAPFVATYPLCQKARIQQIA